ncbi:MAG: hypothetical protein HQM08_20795 [Candidatus Riflebacteria bacterium]|nr:hypothetical protein [Candidatus Riflebacteria bacterium]
MKKRFFLSVFLMVLFGVSSAFAYYTYRDLDEANRMRDCGDFYGARSLYQRIADDNYSDPQLQRNAAYFIGFCDVKLGNPWRALDSYHWFLNRFDNGNTNLIPDALFVLGRTYEDIGDLNNAKFYYRECINRFQYGEFPAKSRERLRIYGEYTAGPYITTNLVQNADAEKSAKAVKSNSDPFDGGFSLNKDMISRVNGLIQAVSKLEGVEEAFAKITPEDQKLEVVKENLRIYQEKQKFESLHEIK